jgi:hypothetical protein
MYIYICIDYLINGKIYVGTYVYASVLIRDLINGKKKEKGEEEEKKEQEKKEGGREEEEDQEEEDLNSLKIRKEAAIFHSSFFIPTRILVHYDIL